MTENPAIILALSMMEMEALRAAEEFPSFHSMHEGYAVILEELDELWDAVRANDREAAMREAVQIGAMAARFIADLSSDEN